MSEKKKILIKEVNNNYEKRDAYNENVKRYNKALKNEFYFEAIWILYAILEDRTSSFFYHLGFTQTDNRNNIIRKKEIKKQIREIFKMKEREKNYQLVKLSGKILRIQNLLEWSKNEEKANTLYKKEIRKVLLNVFSDEEFLKNLNYLNDNWREKRNELTHALLIKNIDSVKGELKPLAEKGKDIFKIIDKKVKKIKNAKIREKFNLK